MRESGLNPSYAGCSAQPTGSIAPYRVVNIVLLSLPLSGIDCTNSKYPTRPRLGHHLTNGAIPMQRPSVYQYSNEDVPGITVQSLRTEKFDISMRELASRCLKKSGEPLNHTTIRRLENNNGFTHDTVKLVAEALGVKPEILFYSPRAAAVLANMSLKAQGEVLALAEDQVVRALKTAGDRWYSRKRNPKK